MQTSNAMRSGFSEILTKGTPQWVYFDLYSASVTVLMNVVLYCLGPSYVYLFISTSSSGYTTDVTGKPATYPNISWASYQIR